jgi:hypothetical protein
MGAAMPEGTDGFITSSISPPSRPERFSACSIAWPPSVAPVVSLKAPR